MVFAQVTDASWKSSVKKIYTDKAPAPIGPYSQAIVAGDTVYCSGSIPVDPTSGEVPQGIEAQTELAIANLAAVLEAASMKLGWVVKTTCFLTDMADFAAFNAVYAKHFTGKPARSCVAVSALPKGVSVEIEAVAVAPKASLSAGGAWISSH